MVVLDEIASSNQTTRPPHHKLLLPVTRDSILDPWLEIEPALDECCCGGTLVLFVHNHPIAVISGTSLDCFALNARLNQLRHRNPRQ